MSDIFYGVFVGEAIDLAEGKYFNCVFQQCDLTYGGSKTLIFINCVFTECRLIGEGWPEWMKEASRLEELRKLGVSR